MSRRIAFLGREANLSRAEIESVSTSFHHLTEFVSEFESDFGINRFGGVVAIAETLERTNQTAKPLIWAKKQIAAWLVEQSTQGKLEFGLSWYGEAIALQQLTRLGLEIKSELKKSGRSCRFVSPKSAEISAAQLKFNQLTSKGYHFAIIAAKNELILSRVSEYQDIDWYSKRDYDRPCRDAKTGMLPPKLAQIMINLAQPAKKNIIADPFCGSGTVLAEALLWGYAAAGSDISAQMVACSQKNLAWLAENAPHTPLPNYELTQADARTISLAAESAIVTEGYLGPVDNIASQSEQDEILQLYRDFLHHIHGQLKSGSQLAICVPVWHHDGQNHPLPLLDLLSDLGYNNKVFSQSEPLIYRRENQRVGRQIIILIRK